MTVLKRRELTKWDGEFRVYFLPPPALSTALAKIDGIDG